MIGGHVLRADIQALRAFAVSAVVDTLTKVASVPGAGVAAAAGPTATAPNTPTPMAVSPMCLGSVISYLPLSISSRFD